MVHWVFFISCAPSYSWLTAMTIENKKKKKNMEMSYQWIPKTTEKKTIQEKKKGIIIIKMVQIKL